MFDQMHRHTRTQHPIVRSFLIRASDSENILILRAHNTHTHTQRTIQRFCDLFEILFFTGISYCTGEFRWNSHGVNVLHSFVSRLPIQLLGHRRLFRSIAFFPCARARARSAKLVGGSARLITSADAYARSTDYRALNSRNQWRSLETQLIM